MADSTGDKQSEPAVVARRSPSTEPAEDVERGDVNYWRERAGRLGTTVHHIAGALARLPGGTEVAEAEVRKLVREFSEREEHRDDL